LLIYDEIEHENLEGNILASNLVSNKCVLKKKHQRENNKFELFLKKSIERFSKDGMSICVCEPSQKCCYVGWFTKDVNENKNFQFC